MRFLQIISNILSEQPDPAILKTSGNKPIVDAIRDRKKISFNYSGPRKPKKNSVKPGRRFEVEPVAMGVNSKGRLILRGWVDSGSGSTTKTGFKKTNWRTFILSRMKNLEVLDDTFEQRPGYREKGDAMMNPVYVQTSFKDKKDIERKKKPTIQPQVEPEPKIKEPEVDKIEPLVTKEPSSKESPLPNPEEKPTEVPTDQSKIDSDDLGKDLYNKKKTDWVNKQKEIGGNTKPGQGTRERFKKEVDKELPQPKPEEKPPLNPEEDEENKNLQESLQRIKTLMFF
jgi:hypothetical protein